MNAACKWFCLQYLKVILWRYCDKYWPHGLHLYYGIPNDKSEAELKALVYCDRNPLNERHTPRCTGTGSRHLEVQTDTKLPALPIYIIDRMGRQRQPCVGASYPSVLLMKLHFLLYGRRPVHTWSIVRLRYKQWILSCSYSFQSYKRLIR